MAPVLSRDVDDAERERRGVVMKAVRLHIFQSVLQHIMTLQSEPQLMLQFCNGDVGKASRYLGGSASVVALLGLVINQAGGRFSDSVGRKQFFALGALMNVIMGLSVYAGPKSLPLFVFCRIVRMVGTTFSGTVVGVAALMDTFPPEEFASKLAQVQAAVGLSVIVAPVAEALVLSKTGNNYRAPYLALAALGGLQFLVSQSLMVETLAPELRKPASLTDIVVAGNPFSFLRVFAGRSKELKQLISIIALQQFLEGKNMSDLGQLFMAKQLKWGVSGIRNFAVSFGFLVVLQAVAVVPKLLKTLGPINYTTLANSCMALGMFLSGVSENAGVYISGFLVTVPGMNGSASNGLRGTANKLALEAGYGSGEFSAIFNSLRAIGGATCTTMLGFAYAWFRDHNMPPGYAYFLASLFGSVLPQVMFQVMDKSCFKAAPEQKEQKEQKEEKEEKQKQ